MSAYPALAWLASGPTSDGMLGVELWLSFLYASYNGAMVAALTEIVPNSTHRRLRARLQPRHDIFGGFTSAISEGLVAATANKATPAFWMMVSAAISLVAALIVYRSPIKADRHSRGPSQASA